MDTPTFMYNCKRLGCNNASDYSGGLCKQCSYLLVQSTLAPDESMSFKYPKYYKDVSELNEIDVYEVHELFQIQDCSGAIQHASKKLLLSGVRTGGKSKFDDIREARDTLNRWLEIHSREPV